jgi:hypothetical protein
MSYLDQYIASRMHGTPDQWTQDQWERSREATAYFNDQNNRFPFPHWAKGLPLRGDYETPGPALFSVQDVIDWFSLGVRHREIQLEVDFDPAPDLGMIHDAFQAARGEAELLVTGYAGMKPGTFEISIEALYVVKGRGLEGPLGDIFGREPNGFMDHGWEWFSGW